MKSLPILLFVTLAAGCAGVGSSKYGCSGLPEGVRCASTGDLYEGSNGGRVPRANSAPGGRDAPETMSGPADAAESRWLTDPVVDTFVTPALPNRPVPIRTPARVMRIWVASWEDTDTGALITPGYIHTEIEPRRWVIGKPESAAQQQNRLFKPLEQSGPMLDPQQKGKE